MLPLASLARGFLLVPVWRNQGSPPVRGDQEVRTHADAEVRCRRDPAPVVGNATDRRPRRLGAPTGGGCRARRDQQPPLLCALLSVVDRSALARQTRRRLSVHGPPP